MDRTDERKRILILSYDFEGASDRDAAALEWKLDRDGIPRTASVLNLCWGRGTRTVYVSERLTIRTLPAFLGRFRPFYDVLFVAIAPIQLSLLGWRPDEIVIADFPLAWAAAAVRLFCGGTITLRLQGLHRQLGATRGRSHGWYHTVNERLGARIPDRFVCINETSRSYLLGIGVAPDRIELKMPDSITRDLPIIAGTERGRARRQLGIPQGAPLVLSVGRLEPEKAFDELIVSFSLLPPEARLVIVGEGRLRAPLEQKVRQAGMQERVFLPGVRSRSAIWDFYKDADVFVLISKSESLGLSLLEAMYMEVPVVGSAVGGIEESIGRDGERGFLWRRNEGSAALKEKIGRCLKKDAEVVEMIERAKRYTEEKIA